MNTKNVAKQRLLGRQKMKRITLFTCVAIVVTVFLAGCSTTLAPATTMITAAATIASTTPSPIPEPKVTLEPTPAVTTPAPTLPTPEPTPTITPVATPEVGLTIGKVTGNTYVNEYFGMTLTKPKSWYFATTEQLAQTYGVSADQIDASSADLATRKGFVGFYLSKYAFGSKNYSAVYINLYCDKVKGTEFENDSPAAYLQNKMGQKATSVTINGVEFAVGAEYDASVKWDYCTIRNGYALYFVLCGEGKAHKEVQEVFETITFK